MKIAPKSQGLYQVKTNDRWKWMASATAVSAAAATSAQANTMVTVTLSNNFIDYNQGNHLSANIFGNGNIFSFSQTRHQGNPNTAGTASFRIHTYKMMNGGGSAYAAFDGRFANVRIAANTGANTAAFSPGTVRIVGGGGGVGSVTIYTTPGKAQVKLKIPIWFMDPSVNGGALTEGFIQATATAMGVARSGPFFGQPGVAKITLDNFMYTMNMPAGVPEGGSTLALLAMGAGGVLAFRQRKKAA